MEMYCLNCLITVIKTTNEYENEYTERTGTTFALLRASLDSTLRAQKSKETDEGWLAESVQEGEEAQTCRAMNSRGSRQLPSPGNVPHFNNHHSLSTVIPVHIVALSCACRVRTFHTCNPP